MSLEANLKYQLNDPWPIGQYLYPSGRVIDTANPDDYWSQYCAGKIPPPSATPLNAETRAVMDKAYATNPRALSPIYLGKAVVPHGLLRGS
jgi:hypothetical protein